MGAARAALSGRRAEGGISPASQNVLSCKFATCSKVADAVSGAAKKIKNKNIFFHYHYYCSAATPTTTTTNHHHHNSVTTISFITMICSFVSPQIHYFLFHFFHQPPSATHSSQICLFTYYETFRYTFFIYLSPNHALFW